MCALLTTSVKSHRAAPIENYPDVCSVSRLKAVKILKVAFNETASDSTDLQSKRAETLHRYSRAAMLIAPLMLLDGLFTILT